MEKVESSTEHNMFKAHLRVGERQAIDPSLSVHVRFTKGHTNQRRKNCCTLLHDARISRVVCVKWPLSLP